MPKPIHKEVFYLFKESIVGWLQSEATLHAAALAYYTIFSLAPLLILSIAIATQVFTQAAVEGKIVASLEEVIGVEAAIVVQDIIKNSQYLLQDSVGIWITIIVMVYGASAMFRQIRYSLDALWGVPPQTGSIRQSLLTMIRDYALSAASALAVGFFLLASLLLNALWTAIPAKYLQAWLPNSSDQLINLFYFVASPASYTLIFALIFKALPNAKVRWRNAWPGAAVTALLFWLGGYLVGLYLSYSTWTSIYGAAGSLIALLIWIYYSAWIFFLGAKFTQVYATRYGREGPESGRMKI